MDLTDVIAAVRPRVLHMVAELPQDKWEPIGTGFVIDGAGYAVTAQHVIEDARQSYSEGLVRAGLVQADDVEYLECQVLAEDLKNDLALLRLPSDGKYSCVSIHDDGVREGEAVAVTGFPIRYNRPITTAGIVARARALTRGPVFPVVTESIMLDLTVDNGMSGGPLYRTRDGGVVGMIAGGIPKEVNRSATRNRGHEGGDVSSNESRYFYNSGLATAIPIGPALQLLAEHKVRT